MLCRPTFYRLQVTGYTFVGSVTRAKKMCDGIFLVHTSDLKKV